MARLRVGLTGGIGSGKTAVADRLAAAGAVIVDADRLAREVVAPGTAGLDAIRDRFGDVVVRHRDGEADILDRAALGRIVFADPGARRDLEAIIHPAVRARAGELEAGAPDDAVVVHVIPLLVETGQEADFDVCVVVDVDESTQLRRLTERDGLAPDEARQRLAAQASRERRLAAADLVIDNSGDLTALDRQVADLASGWSLPN